MLQFEYQLDLKEDQQEAVASGEFNSLCLLSIGTPLQCTRRTWNWKEFLQMCQRKYQLDLEEDHRCFAALLGR